MKIALVHDDPGYVGGAELTMREFMGDTETVPLEEADLVLISNAPSEGAELIQKIQGKRVVQYHHDLSPHWNSTLVGWLNRNAEHIFCSPLQRDNHEADGACIPPALDLDSFRPPRQVKRNQEREGVCSVASWMNPDKGGELLAEVASNLGGVDCYGPGPYKPVGAEGIRDCGEISYSELPQTLWKYDTFIFLPRVIEPFGRAVVEAWAAGCELILNQLVGARYWIEQRPKWLETARRDFWQVLER